jgi:nifR3 family TIM-barrel protein
MLQTFSDQIPARLSQLLNRPLCIGDRSIEGRLVLAPMTFLGHVAFRHLLAGFGGYGLLFTEMCSAKRIPHEKRHQSAYFRWRPQELSHLVCQILGNDPEVMARAARIVQREGFFGVDINFGCSAKTICGTRCGAALLKTPAFAAELVAAVRKAVHLPLFVKFRTGWRDHPGDAVDLAKRFEDAGADAMTFHPRVAPDRRSRPARWEYIGHVKEAVGVPVFGNGDVFDPDDCLRMLETTGCDGVALGRIGIAKPWVFAQWTAGLQTTPDIYRRCALELLRLHFRHFDPVSALRRFKRFAQYYSANFKFGHALYIRIHNAPDRQGIESVLEDFFKTPPDLISRPNLNLFV